MLRNNGLKLALEFREKAIKSSLVLHGPVNLNTQKQYCWQDFYRQFGANFHFKQFSKIDALWKGMVCIMRKGNKKHIK